MHLSVIDLSIIIFYLVAVVLLGLFVTKPASKNIHNYFLGGNVMPWWMLGVSNASGMFDVAGTMLLVYWLAVYGLKKRLAAMDMADFQSDILDGLSVRLAEEIECNDRR